MKTLLPDRMQAILLTQNSLYTISEMNQVHSSEGLPTRNRDIPF